MIRKHWRPSTGRFDDDSDGDENGNSNECTSIDKVGWTDGWRLEK